MELADERRLLEEEVNKAKSESDAVARLRQDYATRLSEIENSMKPDANMNHTDTNVPLYQRQT